MERFSTVLPRHCCTFCSKSSRGGRFWIVDIGTSSGTYIVLKNHWFSSPNAPFQNRSFLGLTTLSVKICTDATHRRKSMSSLQHPLSRVCYDGVAHGQGG